MRIVNQPIIDVRHAYSYLLDWLLLMGSPKLPEVDYY